MSPWTKRRANLNTGLALLALFASGGLYAKFEADARDRRNQRCLTDEREERKEIISLRKTYRYLRDVRPGESPALVQTIRRTLPETERKAREDNTPAYCNEPGVGLNEKDPKIPKRPAALR